MLIMCLMRLWIQYYELVAKLIGKTQQDAHCTAIMDNMDNWTCREIMLNFYTANMLSDFYFMSLNDVLIIKCACKTTADIIILTSYV